MFRIEGLIISTLVPFHTSKVLHSGFSNCRAFDKSDINKQEI